MIVDDSLAESSTCPAASRNHSTLPRIQLVNCENTPLITAWPSVRATHPTGEKKQEK
jgi:hypothetical protein